MHVIKAVVVKIMAQAPKKALSSKKEVKDPNAKVLDKRSLLITFDVNPAPPLNEIEKIVCLFICYIIRFETICRQTTKMLL